MPDFGDSLDQWGGSGSNRYEYEGRYDPTQPSVANGQVSPEEWAEYLARRKKNGILFALGLLGGTSALGALGPMFGGAASGAGATAANAGLAGEIMGTGGVTPLLGAGTTPLVGGTAAGLGTTAGLGAGAATTAGLGGAGAGALTKTAADLVGGKSGGLFGGLSGTDLTALITGLTGLVGGTIAGKKNTGTLTPNTLTSDPQLAKLLATMQGRLDKSEPLIDSIMSMANGLLPTQYQKGGGGMP